MLIFITDGLLVRITNDITRAETFRTNINVRFVVRNLRVIQLLIINFFAHISFVTWYQVVTVPFR